MVAKAHPVLLDASVRTGGDYGVTVSSPNITEGLAPMTVKSDDLGCAGGIGA